MDCQLIHFGLGCVGVFGLRLPVTWGDLLMDYMGCLHCSHRFVLRYLVLMVWA